MAAHVYTVVEHRDRLLNTLVGRGTDTADEDKVADRVRRDRHRRHAVGEVFHFGDALFADGFTADREHRDRDILQ